MPTLNLTVVWDGCSDVLKKRLNSLHRRAVKLIFPDTTLTTNQKLKEMRIMSLQKQPEYNKGLFLYRVLNNEVPAYISNLYTHTPSHCSNSRNYQLSLPRSKIDVFKKKVYPSLVLFYGTTYLWQWDLVSHSAPSSEDFVRTLKQLHGMDCGIILFGREKQSEVFEWLPLQWLVIWDLLYTPIELRPVLRLLVRVISVPSFFLPLILTVLYKISIDCFGFLFQYWSYELIRCSTVLFTGCMLIMYNWVMYAWVDLAMWTRYVLSGNSRV